MTAEFIPKMVDCIEREALTNALDELCDRVCIYSKKQRSAMCGACPLGDAFDVVEALPAVDVRPVVRGRWEYNGPDENVPYCSNCMLPSDEETRFCAGCGADMREES